MSLSQAWEFSMHWPWVTWDATAGREPNRQKNTLWHLLSYHQWILLIHRFMYTGMWITSYSLYVLDWHHIPNRYKTRIVCTWLLTDEQHVVNENIKALKSQGGRLWRLAQGINMGRNSFGTNTLVTKIPSVTALHPLLEESHMSRQVCQHDPVSAPQYTNSHIWMSKTHTHHIISEIIIPENRCYRCHSSLLLDGSHGCWWGFSGIYSTLASIEPSTN